MGNERVTNLDYTGGTITSGGPPPTPKVFQFTGEARAPVWVTFDASSSYLKIQVNGEDADTKYDRLIGTTEPVLGWAGPRTIDVSDRGRILVTKISISKPTGGDYDDVAISTPREDPT